MKNKFSGWHALAVAVIGLVGVGIGCGSKLEGNTYEGNGGIVKIEFKSGGKAFVSTGPATTTCSYEESGKTVTLMCEGDKTVFTVEDDGALSGPPNGLMTRLTKLK